MHVPPTIAPRPEGNFGQGESKLFLVNHGQRRVSLCEKLSDMPGGQAIQGDQTTNVKNKGTGHKILRTTD